MALSPGQQKALSTGRMAWWLVELEALQATPFILIGVSHTGPESGRLQVFVPMEDTPQKALMVQVLRQAADDLEAAPPASA